MAYTNQKYHNGTVLKLLNSAIHYRNTFAKLDKNGHTDYQPYFFLIAIFVYVFALYLTYTIIYFLLLHFQFVLSLTNLYYQLTEDPLAPIGPAIPFGPRGP